jgi:hypothetical protein
MAFMGPKDTLKTKTRTPPRKVYTRQLGLIEVPGPIADRIAKLEEALSNMTVFAGNAIDPKASLEEYGEYRSACKVIAEGRPEGAPTTSPTI